MLQGRTRETLGPLGAAEGFLDEGVREDLGNGSYELVVFIEAEDNA